MSAYDDNNTYSFGDFNRNIYNKTDEMESPQEA